VLTGWKVVFHLSLSQTIIVFGLACNSLNGLLIFQRLSVKLDGFFGTMNNVATGIFDAMGCRHAWRWSLFERIF
jgi:hypothetical protein